MTENQVTVVIDENNDMTVNGSPVAATTGLQEAARQAGPGGRVHVQMPSGETTRWAVDHNGLLTAPPSDAPAELPRPRLTPAPALPSVAGRDPEDVPTVPEPPRFVRLARAVPHTGVRGLMYKASGGRINPGLSAGEEEERDLIRRVRAPLSGVGATAVLALKGGIGKTSTTVGVGLTIAEYRGEAACVVDANPDAGDLAERVLGSERWNPESSPSITDLVRRAPGIGSLTELGEVTHVAGRLHVVAGEQDPELSDALSGADYLTGRNLLGLYYRVILTDCGTGVSHPAMSGILATSSNVVICTSYAVSGARRALTALRWLHDHGWPQLARTAVVILTDKDRTQNRVVDKPAVLAALQGAAGTVIEVPYDPTVSNGDAFRLENIQPDTRRAYLRAAAAIVDGYSATGMIR